MQKFLQHNVIDHNFSNYLANSVISKNSDLPWPSSFASYLTSCLIVICFPTWTKHGITAAQQVGLCTGFSHNLNPKPNWVDLEGSRLDLNWVKTALGAAEPIRNEFAKQHLAGLNSPFTQLIQAGNPLQVPFLQD